MNKLSPHGKFPDIAYRAFSTLEHAEQFINGSIRFGNIYHYKRIEDEKRRDKTEGESHVVYDGTDKQGMFATNTIYINCCHRTLSAALKCNLGGYVVKINAPEQFAKDLTQALEQSEAKYFGGIEGCFVEYTKGMETSIKPGGYEIVRLSYCQKPPGFTPEEEFRFVAIRKTSVGEFLTIQLNQSLKYCEIINGI